MSLLYPQCCSRVQFINGGQGHNWPLSEDFLLQYHVASCSLSPTTPLFQPPSKHPGLICSQMFLSWARHPLPTHSHKASCLASLSCVLRSPEMQSTFIACWLCLPSRLPVDISTHEVPWSASETPALLFCCVVFFFFFFGLSRPQSRWKSESFLSALLVGCFDVRQMACTDFTVVPIRRWLLVIRRNDGLGSFPRVFSFVLVWLSSTAVVLTLCLAMTF